MDRMMYRIIWYLIIGRGDKLIKTMHRHRDEYLNELTQREIDLACGLNDKRKVYFIP